MFTSFQKEGHVFSLSSVVGSVGRDQKSRNAGGKGGRTGSGRVQVVVCDGFA